MLRVGSRGVLRPGRGVTYRGIIVRNVTLNWPVWECLHEHPTMQSGRRCGTGAALLLLEWLADGYPVRFVNLDRQLPPAVSPSGAKREVYSLGVARRRLQRLLRRRQKRTR